MPNTNHCTLLGGPFGYLVQVSLGAVAFSTLLIKRYTERPRRSWLTWLRDASKQGISALVAHGWNMLFAVILNDYFSDDDRSECVWYLANYLIDNAVGVALNYVAVRLSERVARDVFHTERLRQGFYGEPPKASTWAWQLLVWIIIITVVKFFLFGAIILPLREQLYTACDWLLSATESKPKLELVLVMIIVPLICNIIQFYVTDEFLKRHVDADADWDAALLEQDSSSPSPSPSPPPATETKRLKHDPTAYHSFHDSQVEIVHTHE